MRATLEMERQDGEAREAKARRAWDEPFEEGLEGEPSQERMEDFFEGWEAYQA